MKIKIHYLKINSGILPLKLGQAKIQTSMHDFIHYLHLQPIAEEIVTTKNQYNEVTQAIQDGLSNPYFVSLQNFEQVLRYQLKTVKEKFNSVYPTKRKEEVSSTV